MLRQLDLAGGKFRGVLWYQGESDASGPPAEKYEETFRKFIAAVRGDLGQPDLPFYYVQIGRFVIPREVGGWNTVQDAQRRLVDRIPNTAVVATVDLELDDLIHVGTPGLKRLGARLARIALGRQYGLAGATTPTLDHVGKVGDNALLLTFKGVNLAPAVGKPPLPGVPANAPLDPPARAAAIARAPEGLRPERHIAGFSIRKADGTEIPLIFDAAVGPSKDTVVLKLFGKVPADAFLWYGYGLDPYCNLTDALDMAVPVFGPIALDKLD
jgi:sialate O-acetylesterase